MTNSDLNSRCTLKPVFFVVGSTGSGKSATAVHLAHSLAQLGFQNPTVINCDVMQFYEALPVATNKATLEEMKGVPHTFISFLSCHDRILRDPEQPYGKNCASLETPVSDTPEGKRFDVNCFTERAARFIENYFELNSHGAIIVCGGTCYYAEALLFDSCLTPTDDNMPCDDSATLDALSSTLPADQLWNTLNKIDPAVAQRYHPNDTRRLRRLLEIHETTGKLPSEVFSAKEPVLRFGPERTFLIWPFMESDMLFPSLDRRVDIMAEKGLINEVHDFYTATESNKPTTSITGAIGYKEYEMAISSDTDETKQRNVFIEKVKSNTRRYARQQIRWIRNRFVFTLNQTTLSMTHFVQINAEHLQTLSFEHLADALFANRITEDASYPLRRGAASPVPVTQEVCTVCGVTVCGRNPMDAHVQSKRHRGAVKRLAMKRSFEETFCRPLPPSKKSKTQ